MNKSKFISLLEKKGYEVHGKRLSGGYVNDVQLVTARKGDEAIEYVLKNYKSKKEMDNMLRGYNLVSNVVPTPTIAYHDEKSKEVAYDYIKGKSVKDLIAHGDKNAEKSLKKLATLVEKLHSERSYPPRYRRNDSPDEVKLRERAITLHKKGKLSRSEINELERRIRRYIPKNKSVIHGDAHLGNFFYDGNELYLIDTDKVKISDYNADLGKITYAIHDLEKERKISKPEARKLLNLFLEIYKGEDKQGIDLHKFRTPLIEAEKNRSSLDRIKLMLGSKNLEHRVAVAVRTIAIGSIILISQIITGRAVYGTPNNASRIIAVFLIALGLILAYFSFNKNKSLINKK
mgnify:CR=1 FL=1